MIDFVRWQFNVWKVIAHLKWPGQSLSPAQPSSALTTSTEPAGPHLSLRLRRFIIDYTVDPRTQTSIFGTLRVQGKAYETVHRCSFISMIYTQRLVPVIFCSVHLKRVSRSGLFSRWHVISPSCENAEMLLMCLCVSCSSALVDVYWIKHTNEDFYFFHIKLRRSSLLAIRRAYSLKNRPMQRTHAHLGFCVL